MENLGWFGYFLGCYKKYFQFTGRASRTEFWSFQLFKLLFTFILYQVADTFNDDRSSIVVAIWAIIVLGSIIPDLAVCFRRYHDVGKSGLEFVLCAVSPFVCIIAISFIGGTLNVINPSSEICYNSKSFAKLFGILCIVAIFVIIKTTTQAGDEKPNKYGTPQL